MESIGIYWIPLKPNMLPFIIQEVDRVIEKFFALNQRAKEDAEAAKNLELLKISIKARIEDFDNFFKLQFHDYRISFFEKQKYRLRKLLYEAEAEEEGRDKAAARELEIKFVSDNPSADRPRPAARPASPERPPAEPRPVQARPPPRPAAPTAPASSTPDKKVIYSVAMNPDDYRQFIDFKKEREAQAPPAEKPRAPAAPAKKPATPIKSKR